ncbi:hypothetical protein EJB05_42256 [Eragrostis curvula]|uniref:Nucleoplasmin-like domain-containing protein n=1 Tax=Eragrostis curvula TaxID=38414 RepID=A0A5J9TE06_9POAL|nr:hypothetical protein EJB05_42256 [Eragrostis curvula]
MENNSAHVVMEDNPAGVVLDDNHSKVDKDVIPEHYDLSGLGVKAQLCINPLSASLLCLNNKAMRVNKGMKVRPRDKFQCTTLGEDEILYVFEAAVDPSHAASIIQNIQIHVVGKEKILVATLSKGCPRVQLDLVMTQGMQLSHTSETKNVYFNACEITPIRLDKNAVGSVCRTNKEIWEVKPEEEITFNVMEDKKYHLLRVSSANHSTEQKQIDLHVRCGDKLERIGTLPLADRTFGCNLEFEGTFSVSHSSKVADVTFYGYTVSNMIKVELPGPPDVQIISKAAKECDDPEYKAFAKTRKKGVRPQLRKQPSVSLVMDSASLRS